MQIIPTTELQKNFEEAEKRIEKIVETSRWIQVDVTDNIFTAGKTFELELLTKTNFDISRVLLDIHLMVKEPEKWIEKCMFVGASRISGQVEMMEDRRRFVEKIKSEGLEAGLAFDIETEVENIPEETDLILLMGRPGGFGHYPLDERVWGKIEKAKKYGKPVAIDGGVGVEHLRKLEEAGIGIVYSGESYFDMIRHDK